MKTYSIILMLFFFNAGCATQQQDGEILGITVKYHSPLCNDYCRIQFTANKEKKVMIKTPGINMTTKTDRMLIREMTPLTPVNWEKLLASFSLEEIIALPFKSGCPGCSDDPLATLIIVTEHTIYEKHFEGDEPPKAIKKLTRLMNNNLFEN